MEESPVKKVLTGLRTYLHNNLRIDKDFIADLSAAGLLSDSDADSLRSSVTQGGNEALYSLLHYIEWYYDEEMLEKFCVFLDDCSKKAKPRLREVAARIRSELEKHQPGQTHQPDPPPQGAVSGSTANCPPSSPPATQGEPSPTVSTMDERSQKIEEIVDMYRSESTKVRLPEIPELEDDFDDIMIALNTELSSADPKVICKLHGTIRVKYRRYIHGVKPVELPSIPNTASGLYDFIAAKSTPYEILLVHHAIDVLETEDLKRTLQSYESNLGDHLRQTLESYKKRNVTLPLRKDRTHLAIVLSKEQILLSLVLHIKEYLMKYLQLEEAIFEGFGEGCTVLFYSILKVDAVLLALKILSHSAELKRMFDMTHLVVFDYFACDLERATIELPEKLCQRPVEMKDEVDSMLKVLTTKQEELEGGDFLPLIPERDKREAALKEEIATLKTSLEEKELQLENTIHQKDAQLLRKDVKLQQKDAKLREQAATLKQQHALLQQIDAQLKQKEAEIRHKDEESDHQYAVLLHEYQQLQQERDQLCLERDQLQRESSRSLSAKPVVKKPPRNWKDMNCLKILECGDVCWCVAAKWNHIAVGVPNGIKVYERNSTKPWCTIEKGQMGRCLPGVTFDDQEHILVSDYDNSNIKMFTIQGRHVRTIDRGSTTFGPKGITVGTDGQIYVCDDANDCVCVFDVNGDFLFSFGSHGSGDECFDCPEDLCFASDGFLYITDVVNSRICVYDKDGKFIRTFTTTSVPTCISATDCGHLIVSSLLSNEVMILYTTGGDLVHVFGSDGGELGQFNRPSGVSVDSDGLIYIADYFNHRIQVF